ncbi:hypothetical protein GCM10011414_19990 [Croceivirga lutea]|uniref:hypothetical protein n=1 Tax=Croceivirga lutea TaxID=1775167 RepID=UPI00163A5611|nr:hypothetical protein [Croceivirga lutea]GGG50313.1 hypothetical protein GCM10011414_19990 [Croceivirga lutea]
MNNQNCRIGAVTPVEQLNEAVTALEYHYHGFVEKAASTLDSRLADFFEGKANSFKKLLDQMA